MKPQCNVCQHLREHSDRLECAAQKGPDYTPYLLFAMQINKPNDCSLFLPLELQVRVTKDHDRWISYFQGRESSVKATGNSIVGSIEKLCVFHDTYDETDLLAKYGRVR